MRLGASLFWGTFSRVQGRSAVSDELLEIAVRRAAAFFGCTVDDVRRGLSGEDPEASRRLGLHGSDRSDLIAQLERACRV